MDPITQQLKRSKEVLLASHTNPDGDAIGSLIAMGLCLDAMNKNTTLYNESPIPAVYRFLPYVDRVVGNLEETACFDTAVVLDCGDLDRIGRVMDTVTRLPVVINIDHHSTNKGFGDFQRIDAEACATSEIIYHIIKDVGVTITKSIATAIYTGILTDTGSFRFSNTNRTAFAICEEMVSCGVNPYQIAQHVYGTYSLGRIKLLNLALDSIEISKNGKLSMMTLSQNMLDETGTQSQDADGLINYARGIEDVKVAALIQEHANGKRAERHQNQYHVSLRSDGTVDVGAIAVSFGGGGHFSAAGFNIESSLSDLKRRLFTLAEKF
jgi:phosphoesterase RecJ-like protein